MAMPKYGHAVVVGHSIDPGKWINKKAAPGRAKIAKQVIAEYDPSKWLLSHASIIASVDVDQKDPNDPKSNYLIKPEYSAFVNNNGDSWERNLLKNCYHSFIGADNYVEHVQIPELSKGKIIDAAIREVPFTKDSEGNDLTTLYVDILVATSLKHRDLVDKIKTGDYNAMSMGCLIEYSQCSKCGNIAKDETQACKHILYFKKNFFYDEAGNKRIIAELCFTPDHKVLLSNGNYNYIEDINIGDSVITHAGNVGKVKEVMRREYNGKIISLNAEGCSKSLKSTPNHPHYVYDSKKDIFSFKEAEKIRVGDYLVRPLFKNTKNNKDFNEDRAFILGLYAAEGCSCKLLRKDSYKVEFILNAEDEVELAKDLASTLEKEFSPEYKKNGYTGKNKDWNILLKNKKRVKPNEDVKFTGISCRSCGAPEQYLDAYNSKKYRCKICRSRALVDLEGTIVRPSINFYDRGKESRIGSRVIKNNSKKLVVSYYNKKLYNFVKKYCPGNRSFTKSLHKDVLELPNNIQKKILVGWLIGDGSIDTELRLRGYTTSEKLFRNMELISNRLGYWTRSQVIFDDKLSSFDKIRENENLLDSKGCHARFVLYFSPRDCGDLTLECGFVDDYPEKLKETRKKDIYYLYKVKSIEKLDYIGDVYNLSVYGDNSYIVDGFATHNCGRAEDPDSCKFIEGSWVKKPAFEGALLRNIVNPTDDLSEKLQVAISVPSSVPSIGDFAKAASVTAGRLVRQIQAQEGEEESAPAPEAPKDDAGFPEAPEGEGTPLDVDKPQEDAAPEAPAGGGLGDVPAEGPGAEPAAPVPEGDATVKEVKDLLKRNVLQEIRDELFQKSYNIEPRNTETSPAMENAMQQSLVKEASFKGVIASAKRLGNERLTNGLLILSNLKDWKSLKRYGYSREDVIGMMHYIDKTASKEPLDTDIIKALAYTKESSNLTEFFTEIIVETGKELSPKQAKKLAGWRKILKKI